jgi:type I restriction enzyme R subunit
VIAAERTEVELPLIAQLVSMGWQYLEGDTGVPAHTERATFREVLLHGRLRNALRQANLDETGQPWCHLTADTAP